MGKIIQSLMSTDETTTINKQSENMFKVQENFTVLEDNDVTKAVQIPKSLSKLFIFTLRQTYKWQQ